ncbi:MAG: hypothetical protein EOP83_00450 [Verrucomicrobiaceae bacterium]|nr:MAG: hypothetical protein EOP83_00450 [Verrucomicrobiaceae bacterium]
MNTFSLLRNGDVVCDLIPSTLHPIPRSPNMEPGSVVIVVTPAPLDGADGYAMHFPGGPDKPVEVIGSRLGIEGWNTSLRVRQR